MDPVPVTPTRPATVAAVPYDAAFEALEAHED